MLQKESLFVVQFLHPGGEHRPDAAGLKEWNTGTHRRKFLLMHGKALRRSQLVESDLVFWGEWEAQSELVTHFQNPADGDPEYLCRPYFTLPEMYSNLQNTDPFVFGAFLYGICQEFRKTGPTRLRHLGRGSVILFGSALGGGFVLDTVFVVKDWIDHNKATFQEVLHGRVPERYLDVAIAPLYQSGRQGKDACGSTGSRSWRLYRGATFEDPVEGMFSFFPCLPRSGDGSAFRRPIINDDRIVARSQSQGFHLNAQRTMEDVVRLWREIAELVQDKLWLGVHAQMPEKRSDTHRGIDSQTLQ